MPVNKVRIEFLSEGECVKGWFYPAGGTELAHTLLMIPGWPGNPNDVLGMGGLLSE